MSFGNYRIMTEIGRGGMGIVYRAEHVVLGYEVAIKVLHENRACETDCCQRFLAEARAQARINHPHVVRVFDFGQVDDGRIYYVMELLRGEMLSDILYRDGALPLPRALAIVAQVASALGAVHERGIVHRDIKPSNVHIGWRLISEVAPMLCGVGLHGCNPSDGFDHAKLIDFGLVRTADLSEDPNRALGTPLYMAPEQIRSERVDGRTDIYGLGCLLFEMLTGAPPFVSERADDVIDMHLAVSPPLLCSVRPDLNIPEAVEKVVRRALAKDPERRQQTAQGFLAELMACWRSIA